MRRWVAFAALLAVISVASAQDRLPKMPGHEQFQKISKELTGAVKSGAVNVTWLEGGKALEYRHDGKVHRFDIATGKMESKPLGKEEGPPGGLGRFPRREGRKPPPAGVERGRQAGSATSPDGLLKAFHRDRNLWLSDAKGVVEMPLTTDGNEKARIKNGIASWVYGEELFQNTAIWWSPDSKKVAYYRFDESKVPDYYLALGQTNLQTTLDAEPYPKAGAPNPVVDLFSYDVTTKKTTRLDVRDGKPFENDVVGHYVYHVAWSADSKELLFNRTNRRQNVMEFTAADPATGKCRVIIREEWPASWTENTPPMRYLKDNKRFIWTSERTGWRNLYLYDLTGKLLATLTGQEFEVGDVVRVDEDAEVAQVWYTARSGDNPMKMQLHRVALDGSGDVRLTDPAFHHTVQIAPDGKHFIDVIQTHDQPPITRLCAVAGVSDPGHKTEAGHHNTVHSKVVAELAKSDLSKFESLGLKRVELFTFKAADGMTDLYGLLHFPSQFDPEKKYPLLVSVYAGPATNGARETFTTPNPLTEYGFLVATLDSRSAAGRGKRFLDAIYLKLGATEIDDQAAGVKALAERPCVDKDRVGIHGTSYGGYASILCLLRHPDVFHAACASSPVTDFRLYDSIYTERYLWLPQENKSGYDEGSALTHAAKLKGRLMLYFGTSDNNVHPSNTYQLIAALQKAGKSFELQVGPDRGHSGISQQRMMEFFIENLVMGR